MKRPSSVFSLSVLAMLVAGALLLGVRAAEAAGTLEQQCQAAKNKSAGKYAACRQNAEAKFVRSGDDGAMLARCETSFTRAWQKAEIKAAAAGATCLDGSGTEGAFQPILDESTDSIADALAGLGLPPADLVTCTGDLGSCTGDLGTCQADLAVCTGGTPQGQLLQTGQTTCWHGGAVIPCAGTGQDGELQQGRARAYVDNADGTITDTLTGLMWEKLSDDGSIHDKDTEYTWANAFGVKVAALNGGGGFAGHNDWRIPNVIELQSLVSYGASSPSVDAAFNTACVPTCTVTTCSCTRSPGITDAYWAATSGEYNPSHAWTVLFNDGFAGVDTKGREKYARAVRGGSLGVPPAETAGTSEQQRCQATKNRSAGKYVACRQSAEAKFVASGHDADALAKCGTTFTKAWQEADAKAAETGTTCLDGSGTEGAFQPVVEDFTDNNAAALAGLGPPSTALAICIGDLRTCTVDLGACQTNLAVCTGGAPQGQLLRTGQTTCRDVPGKVIACAGTGQDGELQHGLAHAYVDNGDGTITDTLTGLMWEKLSDDGSIHDKDTEYTWANAFAVKVAALNDGGGFAGYSDWRVPNVIELQSLLSYGAGSPAVNAAFNTACAPTCTVTTCSCTNQPNYWSSTTSQGTPSTAWFMTFNHGEVTTDYKAKSYYVRGVRGGS